MEPGSPGRWLHRDPFGIEWTWRSVGEEIHNIEDLPGAVDRALTDPEARAEERARCRREIFGGLTDGRARERVAEHITALKR